MSIIEKQIRLKVTAEQAKHAREEFKNSVAKLSEKLQQENIKKTKGTSAKELKESRESFSLIVKATAKDLPRKVVESKEERRKFHVQKVAHARVERQQQEIGLNA